MANNVHIILGAPENDLSLEALAEGKIIGVDGGALLCLEANVQMDVALGDFDSITPAQLTRVKEKADTVIQYKVEKDDTDAEIALLKAEELFEPDQIIVHNWAGGRLDHLMSTLMMPLQPRFKNILPKIELINKTNKIRYFLPGSYVLHREQNKKYCSVIGMTPLGQLSLNEGFKYQLNKVDYSYPAALVSNEFVNDTAELTFDSGVIAFMQSKD